MNSSDDESVLARGQRIISLLFDAGRRAGLIPEREYPIPGGRIDVVWLWKGPPSFPSLLPVVGFEVESSWRTRKHLKGDYANLVDLQPALGAIVLLGEGEDVESTRRFLRKMLDGCPGRIEVWSEEDVKHLAESPQEIVSDIFEAAHTPQDLAESLEETQKRPVLSRVGKYRRLAHWLAAEDREQFDSTFREVEEALGFPLPPSCRRHEAHWYGYDNTAVGRAIQDAGWQVKNVRIPQETLTFVRTTSQA
jgi:hypothetical protein